MEKKLTVSTNHSTHDNKDTQKIELKMIGGSPYFQYLWINDVCYTIRKKTRSIELEKTK